MATKSRVVLVNDSGYVIGQDHHRAKLTDHQVWLVHEMLDRGLSYKTIAEQFGISKSSVAWYAHGLRRAHTAVGQKRLDRKDKEHKC